MATKKKITDDWQQLFPELKKTKLLEMDNRLGPLITGIYLKVVRNTYYTPVAYVHNLCREYSSITTSLECTSETIALGVDELTGAVTDYEVLIQALLMVSPMPVSFIEIESGAKGYCNVTKRVIAIQKDMSQLQTVKTMIHEIAHAMLHADNDKVERKDAGTREVEAESIAYVVCQYLGLDTSDYSFAYLIGWSSGRQMPELRASLHTIQTTAADLIDRIEEQIRKAEPEDSGQETSDVAGDYFEIYQLKENMENRQFYFMDLSFWQSRGVSVEHTRYDVTYTAPLDEKTTLDDIYCRFNIDRPSDFFGHSLSVSDVVVLHRKGKTDSYFVDNIGFQPVTDFFKKEPKDVAV